MKDGFRGATPPGVLNASPDRRVGEMGDYVQLLDPEARSAFEYSQDTFSTAALNLLRTNRNSPIQVGKVVQLSAYCNWYKVQTDRIGAAIPCSMLSFGSPMPLGVTATTTIPVNSMVLVYRPPGLPYGFIIGVIPEEKADGSVDVPDFVSQAICTGIRRDQVHYDAIKQCQHDGAVRDFSGHRPLDSTSFDWGFQAETGLGIHIDSFQTFLRVNEVCGLFLNYFDSHARLAGWNFDLQTAAHELTARDDQGETLYYEGHNPYPWEGLGLLAPGQTIHQERDDKKIQFEEPYAKLDLPDGQQKIQSFHRYQEYGGYLGQGRKRTISVPAQLSGQYTYDQGSPAIGVFDESIGLDGEYVLQSAHSVIIAKHLAIPSPQRLWLPEDQMTGDGADEAPYRFSGMYGDGREHKVGNVLPSGDDLNQRTAAGIMDYLTHAFNWKGLHPFHYHEADFHTPNESELPFGRAVDQLDFGALRASSRMSAPQPVEVPIDHRMTAELYRRLSYFALLPNGGIAIGDGFGSEIRMTEGNIEITCPGDVRLMPGKSIVGMAGDDCVLRARASVDITASDNDVRIKAERNLQILGGNSGTGGVLIESKAAGENNKFAGIVGEDIQSSGVMLKSSSAPVVCYGASVYMRTGGGGGLQDGEIVLDASKGGTRVAMYGNGVDIFASQLAHHMGAQGEEDSVRKSHLFTESGVFLNGACVIGGACIIAAPTSGAGGLVVEGNIVMLKGGQIGNDKGGLVGDFKSEDINRIQADVDEQKSNMDDIAEIGKSTFRNIYKQRYEDSRIGNSDLISQAVVSLRNAIQYGTQDFRLTETRWQQIDRLSGSSIGRTWQEPAINAGSEQTFPYPGRDALLGPTFYQLEGSKLFDFTNGRSKDRSDPAYEQPEIESITPVTLQSNYKTL